MTEIFYTLILTSFTPLTTSMTPLKNILCPVDFSEASYDAIEKASFLARLFQANLTLLHVIPPLAQSLGLDSGPDRRQEILEASEERARTLMRQAKRRFIPYAVNSKSSIRVGRASEEILADAERLNSDLIVMAAQGTEVGKSLKTVMDLAQCPVMAYRRIEQSNELGEQLKGFRKILLPLPIDTDLNAPGHLESYIETYLSHMSPELVMAKMIEPDISQEERVKTRLELEALGEQFIDMGLNKVRCHMLEGTYSADLIVRLAQQEGCDLIMMDGPSPPSRRQDIGGFTHQVAKAAEMPVFTMRAGRQE